MLRIAVQSKGRLFEETMALLQEADIKIPSSKRILLVQSSNFPVEVLFLRDDDIPQSVANGVADLGIVGENEFVERNEDAEIVKRLGFSKCRLSLAIPKAADYNGIQWFNGKKIATSYPHILKNFLDKNGVKAEIHTIMGSVEIAPGIGMADCIFDIVSSGSTLVSNNLKEVEVAMYSEALLIGNKHLNDDAEKMATLKEILFRFDSYKNAEGKKLTSTFIGFSRIDNSIIVKVVDCGDKDTSIADVFASKVSMWNIQGVTNFAADGADAQLVRPDLVAGMADHVQGFANFFNGDAEPMTRAQNETGVGNTIGARMFTKLVQMGAYEVTGTVTRQQLQDMPLYGVDVIGKVLEAMQNQISQEINNRILDRVFKLGVENWRTQRDYQGVDLNLYIGGTVTRDASGAVAPNGGKQLSQFGAYRKFVGLDGQLIPSYEVVNAVKNTAAENVHTHQRRIMSRVLAASNLIANVSRYGRGSWIVTNTQILSALQDCAGFVYAPMANTMTQDGSQSIYFAGSLAGLNIYVDPFMAWDDTRICVGRKSDGKTPGVVFMPYILADTVQIVAEGTMAPKLLVNSRFAIVDAGFHPAQNYYTFMVDADSAYLL